MDNSLDPSLPDPALHRRILLVAHDVIRRGSLYDLLVRHGYYVKTVFSAERALASLRHERPDLILVGSCDDECGGLGLPDRVRAFDSDLPMILLGDRQEFTEADPRLREDIQMFLPDSVPENTLVAAVEQVTTPRRPAKPLRYPGCILIVDDEPELLSTLKDFLEARGCNVVTATSGEAALVQLGRYEPSLVLLDIKLGGMDGLITLKKIKEEHPNLPVIMTTALEDQEMMSQAFALGAYEYLTKPYNLAALQGVLTHLKTLLML